MARKVSLLRLKGVPILEQLKIEEALLRADTRNWCVVNTESTPAIVMGISGKQELLINSQKLQQAPIPVIRRFSGGGTVVVDPSTYFVTWICNTEDVEVDCCPQKIHRWTGDHYSQAFPAVGIRLIENDYAIGERKCGGNAQYLCRGRWLHHTSFLWDYSPEMMGYLLMPQKTPSYRLGRDHNDFLCKLKEYLPDKSLFVDAILEYVKGRFDVEEHTLETIQDVLQLPHRRTTTLL